MTVTTSTVISSDSKASSLSNTDDPLSVTKTNSISTVTTVATAPVSSHSYTPGWCGVHVSQYLRSIPENPSPNFKMNFRIYDGAQALLAALTGDDAPSGHTISIVTLLPTVLNVTVQSANNDPVLFGYNDVYWDSSDSRHCKFGGYSTSKREGDCGFTC